MIQHIFSGHVQVEIQGPKVLRLLQRTIQYAKYEVVGFEEKVAVQDSRTQGLQAIDYLEASGDATYFPDEFSSPAYAQIFSDENDVLQIHLSDNHDEEPEHFLWIAIGISDEIPFYDYEFQWIEFFNSNTIGMITIFSKNIDDDFEAFFLPTTEGVTNQEEDYAESLGWR